MRVIRYWRYSLVLVFVFVFVFGLFFNDFLGAGKRRFVVCLFWTFIYNGKMYFYYDSFPTFFYILKLIIFLSLIKKTKE